LGTGGGDEAAGAGAGGVDDVLESGVTAFEGASGDGVGAGGLAAGVSDGVGASGDVSTAVEVELGGGATTDEDEAGSTVELGTMTTELEAATYDSAMVERERCLRPPERSFE
jgi:hypothetical protein